MAAAPAGPALPAREPGCRLKGTLPAGNTCTRSALWRACARQHGAGRGRVARMRAPQAGVGNCPAGGTGGVCCGAAEVRAAPTRLGRRAADGQLAVGVHDDLTVERRGQILHRAAVRPSALRRGQSLWVAGARTSLRRRCSVQRPPPPSKSATTLERSVRRGLSAHILAAAHHRSALQRPAAAARVLDPQPREFPVRPHRAAARARARVRSPAGARLVAGNWHPSYLSLQRRREQRQKHQRRQHPPRAGGRHACVSGVGRAST